MYPKAAARVIGVKAINSNIITLIVAAFLLVIGFLAVEMMTGSNNLSFIEPSEEQKRAAAIFQLNQGTPKNVGNGTRLDRVVAVGAGVQYQFTMMELSRDDTDAADFHDFIYETARPQICSHPQLVGFFDTKAGFVEYRVYDRNGVLLTDIRFDKSDCE